MRLALSLAVLASPAVADAPAVVADIPPVHSLVAAVMEGRGAPALLLTGAADPHSHSLRPSEATALEEANLVVLMGEALTPWIGGPLSALAPDALRLELLDVEGLDLIEVEDPHDGEEGHAHGAEEHDEDDHGGDHSGHDHGPLDPHAWLDPETAAAFAAEIAARLSEIDPDGRPTYEANRDSFVAAAEVLTPPAVDARPWIAGHDAYAYASRWVGAPAAGAVMDVDNLAPGAARLRELSAIAGEAACVIAPPDADARLLAAAGNLPVVTLDPLGRAHEPGPALWPALMADVSAAFEECLSP
ncbi:zinc transport system substrate-binding protein [Hasllibacter halocynthiae]|uniref:High-affinity zinc uptake system protein ZnuA n=1 Tax=Hasllibacter halocynthiae TaxID=595589 RepID=A0A2T0X7I2_9RHOB|nr:zinc ABC transporter substrate-binding protein [Hasllibacter halocynthiae]PRY94834.1 zinc transport system substrate-binding protein [Hasllibacter halocynthiae]